MPTLSCLTSDLATSYVFSLWIKQVNVDEAIDFLYQLNRSLGLGPYLISGIYSRSRLPESVYRISEPALTPELLRFFQ